MNEQNINDSVVYVSCKTYNHAPYIKDAMNGFTMQETNFPYICAIVDDASTDSEQEVIKNYLEEYFDLEDKTIVRQEETDDYVLTFARHKTNLNCHFAVLYLKYNHYSIKKSKSPYLSQWQDKTKYIAVCEGDDYWISPQKLQMQVDFMESNPEYAMCYTLVKRFRQKVHTFEKKPWGGPSESFDDLFGENTIPTLSVLYRREVGKEYEKSINPGKQGWKMGDYPRWLWFAKEYKVKFIPIVTGVYRILEESASHSRNFQRDEEFARSTYAMKSFFIDYYDRHDLENKNDLYLLLFKVAIRTEQRELAISLFPKIEKPQLKTRLKYIIAKIPMLYKVCKGRIFC